jgi:hypothetical protein
MCATFLKLLPKWQKILACMENQATVRTHMESIVGIYQDHSEKILSQGSAIKFFHNLTGSVQHRLSKVEEAIDSNMERILVTVDSDTPLETGYANLERRSNRMDEQLQQHRAAAAADGESSIGAVDSCETGIFVSGIQNFKKIFERRPTTDSVNVTGRLMHEYGTYGAINHVHLADKAVDKKERYKARAVIIYFNTLFHKRQTVIELVKFLQMNPGLHIWCLPCYWHITCSALNQYAADKRQEKSMTRTRVKNKSSNAVLQHTEGVSKEYKDSTVSDSDLEPGERGEGGRQVDRRGRNRNERELRDQNRAAQRANNSAN